MARFNLDSRPQYSISRARFPVGQPANPEKILLEAVDEGLLVPGEIVRAAIYERIERSYQVRREWTGQETRFRSIRFIEPSSFDGRSRHDLVST